MTQQVGTSIKKINFLKRPNGNSRVEKQNNKMKIYYMGSAVNLEHQKKKSVNLKMDQQNVIQSETQRKKIEEKQSISETYEATSSISTAKWESQKKRKKKQEQKKN